MFCAFAASGRSSVIVATVPVDLVANRLVVHRTPPAAESSPGMAVPCRPSMTAADLERHPTSGVPSVAPARLTYQPALDGLRAVAVGAVLLYHHQGLAPDGIGRGGFIGVDVFFVLSGFLITSLLVLEHGSTNTVSLPRFWSRRVRRLAPALLAALLLTVVLSRLVYPAPFEAIIHEDVLWTLLYAQNWHVAVANGGLDSPLLHMWSVSVEEQWYLVWPVVLMVVLTTVRTRRTRVAVVAALAIAGALWTAYVFDRDGTVRAYYGTDTRAQELLVGAALALGAVGGVFVLRGARRRALDVLGLLGLVGIVVFVAVVPDGPGWKLGGFTALAVVTAIVIAAAVQEGGPVRWLLARTPLVLVGRVSYGLYLFHLPIYAWVTPTKTGLSRSRAVGGPPRRDRPGRGALLRAPRAADPAREVLVARARARGGAGSRGDRHDQHDRDRAPRCRGPGPICSPSCCTTRTSGLPRYVARPGRRWESGCALELGDEGTVRRRWNPRRGRRDERLRADRGEREVPRDPRRRAHARDRLPRIRGRAGARRRGRRRDGCRPIVAETSRADRRPLGPNPTRSWVVVASS